MDNSMNSEDHTRFNWWINALPRVVGVTAIAAGSIVIVGWIFDIQLLMSILPNLVSMKANAAIAFVIAGMALLLRAPLASARQRMVSRFMAFLLLLVGLITVAEYAFNWDAGIDQLLFNEPQGTIGTFLPGRMAFNSALNFSLLGFALLTLGRKTRWSDGLAQVFALLVGLSGMLAIVAYTFGLAGSSGLAVYTRMALHTAVTFILLSVGLVCLSPEIGIMAVVRDEGSAGHMARRLMLAAIVLPVLLGWLVVQGERLGLYGNQFCDVIDTTIYIAVFVFVIWIIGRSLITMDVERRRLEQSLFQSEIEFRELFDNAPVGYHELDAEGRISRINQTELRSLGYRVEEMLGHVVWEFVSDPEVSRRAIMAKLSGTEPPARGVERIFIRKDGTTITVMIQDRLLLDVHGDISGIRSTLQDVSDLKKARDMLRKSEEEHRTVLQNLAEGICIADGNERFTFVNRAAESLFGVSSGNLIGRSLQEFVDPKEFEKIREQTARRQKGETASYEMQITRPDGEKRDLLLTASPFTDKGGRVTGAIGVFRDLTERKRSEASLKQSVSLLQATLESTADGILVVDNSGKIESYNKEFARMWMIPDDVVESKDDDRALNHVLGQLKDPDAFISKVRELYAHPDEKSFDVLEFKDGRVFERYSLPQRIDGKPIGRVWSFRNVTERKRAEAALAWEQYLLNSLLQNVPDHIYFKDGESRFMRVSRDQARMFGLSDPSQAVGKTDFDFFTEEHAKRAFADEQEILRTGQTWTKEENETWSDRHNTWVLTTKMPLRDNQGNIIGTFGISRDITERKRTEQERESLIIELKKALEQVKTLGGLVPICASCKKIRDDKGYWNQLEKYLGEHTDAKLTHGLCPDCARLYFPDAAAKLGL